MKVYHICQQFIIYKSDLLVLKEAYDVELCCGVSLTDVNGAPHLNSSGACDSISNWGMLSRLDSSSLMYDSTEFFYFLQEKYGVSVMIAY